MLQTAHAHRERAAPGLLAFVDERHGGDAAYASVRIRAMRTAWLSRVVVNQGAAELRLPPDELDAISLEGLSVRARCS
jgi:hypothetical protein